MCKTFGVYEEARSVWFCSSMLFYIGFEEMTGELEKSIHHLSSALKMVLNPFTLLPNTEPFYLLDEARALQHPNVCLCKA